MAVSLKCLCADSSAKSHLCFSLYTDTGSLRLGSRGVAPAPQHQHPPRLPWPHCVWPPSWAHDGPHAPGVDFRLSSDLCLVLFWVPCPYSEMLLLDVCTFFSVFSCGTLCSRYRHSLSSLEEPVSDSWGSPHSAAAPGRAGFLLLGDLSV